jgi:DNA-binding protein HU-beta
VNKQELIQSIAKKTKFPKSQILSMLDSCIENIEVALKKGQDVRLVGFGTWKKRRRKARTGRNPKTGKSLKIPARNVAAFKMGQHLFDKLN